MTIKHDGDKTRYDLIPPKPMHWLAKVLTFGAKKYAPNNWRTVPESRDRYYAALMRHIEAWRMGQFVDEETGYPHLAHALCCLVFLLELHGEHPAQPRTTDAGPIVVSDDELRNSTADLSKARVEVLMR